MTRKFIYYNSNTNLKKLNIFSMVEKFFKKKRYDWSKYPTRFEINKI